MDNTNLHKVELDNNIQFSELPLRLFAGNPNLVDISMRGNNLQTLDAIQFPLDRLQRLMLANNPLECNCSLLWLWRLTTGNEHERGGGDNNDDDDENSISGGRAATTAAFTGSNTSSNNLILDKDEISCFVRDDERPRRRQLAQMSEGDIKCPAHLITIISAILTVLLLMAAVVTMFFYLRTIRRRKRILEERKNVNERIVPQKIDRVELERYLAAQQAAITNDYHALRPWEVPIKDAVKFNEISEPDHYEHFEYYDHKRTLHKPHVVYV